MRTTNRGATIMSTCWMMPVLLLLFADDVEGCTCLLSYPVCNTADGWCYTNSGYTNYTTLGSSCGQCTLVSCGTCTASYVYPPSPPTPPPPLHPPWACPIHPPAAWNATSGRNFFDWGVDVLQSPTASWNSKMPYAMNLQWLSALAYNTSSPPAAAAAELLSFLGGCAIPSARQGTCLPDELKKAV